jgi:uncharacterized protein involved in exopolysaccharide biosynthesis
MRAYSEENKRLTQRVTSTQKEFSELQRKYHEIDANHISLQVCQSTYVYIYTYTLGLTNNALARQFEKTRLEQERDALKNSNTWLDKELNQKSSDILELRKQKVRYRIAIHLCYRAH